MKVKRRVAVLISGAGTNLQSLLNAARASDFPANIALVISNKADAYGLKRAARADVPAKVIDHKAYKDRQAFEEAVHEALVAAGIEIVCLAGFMRLLGPVFVKQWEGRMLNIHPSLLPEFKGPRAVHATLAAGATKTGCTVHLVTEELDAGPILLQAEVPVVPGDTVETLHARIREAEHQLYPQALRKLAETLAP